MYIDESIWALGTWTYNPLTWVTRTLDTEFTDFERYTDEVPFKQIPYCKTKASYKWKIKSVP